MEKDVHYFKPEYRTIETRYASYWIMTQYGWRQFQLPFQAITGWEQPVIKEKK